MNKRMVRSFSAAGIIFLAGFFCIRIASAKDEKATEVKVMEVMPGGGATEVPADSVIRTGFQLKLLYTVTPDDLMKTRGKGRIEIRAVKADVSEAGPAVIWSGIDDRGLIVIEKSGDLSDGSRVEYTKINTVPSTAEDYLYYGNQFVKAREYYQAADLFGKAMDIKPEITDANQYFTMGMAFQEIRNYDRAIQMFERALKINPRMETACLFMANAYTKRGDPDIAIKFCKKALSISPRFADAYSAFGAALIKQGKAGKAVKMCEKAQSIEPGSAYGCRVMGEAYYLSNRIDKSLAVLRKAIVLDPNQAHPYRIAALGYMQKGDQKRAMEYMKQSAQLGDTDAKQYLIDHQ